MISRRMTGMARQRRNIKTCFGELGRKKTTVQKNDPKLYESNFWTMLRAENLINKSIIMMFPSKKSKESKLQAPKILTN